MKLLTLLLILSTLTATAQKKPAPISRDTIWYPEKRYDTIAVPTEMTDGKIITMLAIYQHGRNIAGKDAPRLVKYLTTNKRTLTASQKPKRVRWDKMKYDSTKSK